MHKIPGNLINEIEKNSSDLWTFLTKIGIIEDVEVKELLEYIAMTKQQKREQEILQKHIENFYHIWQNDKGVYLSYLPAPDKPKGRKPVSATTREKLERKLIDFYLSQEAEKEEKTGKNTPTLRTLLPSLYLPLRLCLTPSTLRPRRSLCSIPEPWTR